MNKSVNYLQKLLLIPVATVVLGLSACASAPKLPTAEIKRAEAAINVAEEARVADYASAELRLAREKLVGARELVQKAAQDKDQKAAVRAAWLAEEAVSDAELATAKAQQERAKEVNQKLETTIDVLQQEIQRDK